MSPKAHVLLIYLDRVVCWKRKGRGKKGQLIRVSTRVRARVRKKDGKKD